MLTIFTYVLQLDYCAHEQKAHGQQLIGVVNICDTHGPYQAIRSIVKPVFTDFDSFVVPTSCSDAQMWQSGHFRDDNNRQTKPIALPLVHAHGVNIEADQTL